MTTLTITKILPTEKKIWVENLTPEYYDKLTEDGWKIYWSSDKKGKDQIVIKCSGGPLPSPG